VRAPRRLAALVMAGVALLGLLAAAAWIVHGEMPLRSIVAGQFDAYAHTPAQAHQLIRAAEPESSWPMFGGSPARTRYVPSELRPPFKVAYTIRGRSMVEMPPIVATGRVVFGTHAGLVIASSLHDGRRLWVTDLGRCIASAPAVFDGVVYIGWSGRAPCRRGKDETGGIVALRLSTGEELWRFSPGNVESSPAVVDGTLYFSAYRSRSESRVYAVRLSPVRRVRWSYPIASKVASAPALIGRTLFVSAYNRNLYSFDAWTGRLRWRTTAFSRATEARLLLGVRSLLRQGSWTEGGFYANPAVAYRRVYLGTIDGVFSAFDARTGTHRWSRRLGGSIYGSAAIWEEKVYVGSTNGTFYALSARDGRVRWKRDLGGKILGSATVTNGRVYVSTTAGTTFALSTRTGTVEWRFSDGQYSPLVVAGQRALLVGKGRVYGLERTICPVGCRVA
jgi:outer membrane protein assembly factor BamB